ncbi:DUF1778 domain-containing protein [Thiotrichales bacterium 19S11-10]|nr:DUF1778 domain-containing protein [Thiotrichales bacterium 19S11-10]
MKLQQINNYTAEKSARLEARTSPEQKKLIKHAADLCGQSLTDFILLASQEAANKVIYEHEVTTLTAKESKNFVNALMKPSKPNSALKKAAKRHHDFFDKD